MSRPDVEALIAGVLAGDRVQLGRALTLVESTRPEDRAAADELVTRCLRSDGRSTVRIGITGSPGVGKSTFIEALGSLLVDEGHSVAVLAVDPSSSISGGSILGDKTRMAGLARNPAAFVRPSPSGRTSGGVARATREAITVCEAAGFGIVFVETVGAGQADTSVHGMVDCFVLLAMPDAGDELQGIKRGIVEMADVIVVNRADGENIRAADRTRAGFLAARKRYASDYSDGRQPIVHLASGLTGEGLDRVWTSIQAFVDDARSSGRFDVRRREQRRTWMHALIRERLLEEFAERVHDTVAAFEAMVVREEIGASAAADAVLERFRAAIAGAEEDAPSPEPPPHA